MKIYFFHPFLFYLEIFFKAFVWTERNHDCMNCGTKFSGPGLQQGIKSRRLFQQQVRRRTPAWVVSRAVLLGSIEVRQHVKSFSNLMILKILHAWNTGFYFHVLKFIFINSTNYCYNNNLSTWNLFFLKYSLLSEEQEKWY